MGAAGTASADGRFVNTASELLITNYEYEHEYEHEYEYERLFCRGSGSSLPKTQDLRSRAEPLPVVLSSRG